MNPLLILAPVSVLCALYGVIRLGRFFFLLGYFLYGIVVVSNELILYYETGESIRIAYACLWGAQSILTFPNRLRYDGSKAYRTFGYKTFLVLTLINAYGIYLANDIPNVEPFIKQIAQIYHGVLAFLPLVGIVLIYKGKIPESPFQ